MPVAPILLLGAGRMGGALVQGWKRSGAFRAADLLIRDPHPSPEASAAAAEGARLNPSDAALAEASTVLLAVKPQVWREAAAAYAALLAPDAVVVSILVGVKLDDIAAGFSGRRTARVMPTTGVAIAKGVASIHAPDTEASSRAHALFDPVATTADIGDEGLMDAASAVSGSAPAFVYAFVEALEAAGVAHGLAVETTRTLVRATLHSASALLEQSGEEPGELRRQVTSPGGTTQAALGVLMGERGFEPLMNEAVAAAIARARALAAS
jgi:pyrroline-5-carboxylate reductase